MIRNQKWWVKMWKKEKQIILLLINFSSLVHLYYVIIVSYYQKKRKTVKRNNQALWIKKNKKERKSEKKTWKEKIWKIKMKIYQSDKFFSFFHSIEIFHFIQQNDGMDGSSRRRWKLSFSASSRIVLFHRCFVVARTVELRHEALT